MKHFARRSLTLFALASPLIAQSPPAPEPESERPYPVLVTDKTRADPQTLELLEKSGTILRTEDFESADALKHFFEVRGADDGRVAIENDPKIAHSGKCALRCSAPAADGKSSGAGASAWLGDTGFERVDLRYYVKFAADYDQGNLNHTGGELVAASGVDKWAGMGTAGLRPKGDDEFSARFEPWRDWGRQKSPGYLFLCTYWMDMRIDRDGHYWGNMLGPAESERYVPERDRWICCELMLKANSAGEPDGELAAWIDGKLYEHYTGIRWRGSAAVLLKRFDLSVYVHEARQKNTAWFDDVVLSTGYVGAMVPSVR